MEQWLVKSGNTSVQDVPVYDKDDVLLTNLATATEIKFEIKKKKTDTTAEVTKTVGSGIEVDTASSGYLRITLLPADTGTTLSVGDYFMALQLKWSSAEIYEGIIKIDDVKTERFRIKQDII